MAYAFGTWCNIHVILVMGMYKSNRTIPIIYKVYDKAIWSSYHVPIASDVILH